jgi:succinate dehydrogenase / fumarate reductase cytochrome b subunit
MAVTGLVLIAFLLVHMYGNLKMFLGPESFDHYAEWLQVDILYPLIPKGWFIWLFRAVLLLCVVLHMYSAITLWLRAKKATPDSYAVRSKLAQTHSSMAMRWGGVVLAGFLVFHILQFTAKMTLPSGYAGESAYARVVAEFGLWWMVAFYALWLLAIALHIRHGFWSAFSTLGANTSPKAERVLNALAWCVALLLYLGFMVMPVSVFFGWIG